MRHAYFREVLTLALVTLTAFAARATDVSWTNANGGNWSRAANWSPNALPGTRDNVFIIAPGNYTVTQDVNVTATTLIVGDGVTRQTLTNDGHTLNLSSGGWVRYQAVFGLGGGTVSANNLVIDGLAVWSAGSVAGGSAISIGTGGVLDILGAGTKLLHGVLTNAGLARVSGDGALGLCAATVVNLGSFELQNDQPLYYGAYCGQSLFRNGGWLRKTGGDGTNRFLSVPLANWGIVEADHGWISFAGGSWFGTGTQFLGAGTNLLDQGTVTFDGTIVSTNAELAGANLVGTNTIVGTLRWTGGNIGAASITIAPAGQLEITGPTAKALYGILNNEGLVRLTGSAALAFCESLLVNDGVFDLENDQPLYVMSYCRAPLFRNAGWLRKTAGTGTNLFMTVPLANTGIVEAQHGWISFANGSWFGSGTQFLGAGTNLLDQGNVTFDGLIVTTNAELAGATLLGTNTVQGRLRWTGGNIGNSAHVTIDALGQLEITGSAPKALGGTLSNHGWVRLTGAAALALCECTLDNTGVFDLENDQPLYLMSYCRPPQFHNAGLMRKTAGVGTNLFMSVPLANTGIVEAQQGWISFANGSWFGSGTQLLGAGTNLLDQGNVTFDGTIVSTNAELAGATLLGTSTVLGKLRWTGGNIGSSAQVTIGPSGQLEITGPAPKGLGGILNNQGLIRLTGAAALGFCESILNNAGVFDLENDQPLYLMSYCRPPQFCNAGSLRKTSGAGTNLFMSVPLANTGTVEVQTGTLAFDSGFTQTAGRSSLCGGNLSSTRPFEFQGGVLCGAGELYGDVHQRGELNPGQPVGALTVHGACTCNGRANLELGGPLPGSSHDRVNITGAALLNGTINVTLVPGYRPNNGDAFVVLTFGSRIGNSPRFNGLNLGGGGYLTPVFSATNLTLLATNGPVNLYELLLVPGAEKAYELRFTGLANEFYTFEASVYLTNDWITLYTSNSACGVLSWVDAQAASYPQRFYRARPAY